MHADEALRWERYNFSTGVSSIIYSIAFLPQIGRAMTSDHKWDEVK